MRTTTLVALAFVIGGVCGFVVSNALKSETTSEVFMEAQESSDTSVQVAPLAIEPQPNQEIQTPKETPTSTTNSAVSTDDDDIESDIADRESGGESAPQIAESIIDTDPHSTDTNDYWVQERKSTVESLIKEHNTEGIDFIIEKVINDNPFYNERLLETPPLEDEFWAIQMQQDLYLLLNQHQNVASGQAVIQDLSCKHLICEVIVTELTPNIWMPVYIETLGKLATEGYSLDTASPHNYQFTFGDGGFVYNQFVFKG